MMIAIITDMIIGTTITITMDAIHTIGRIAIMVNTVNNIKERKMKRPNYPYWRRRYYDYYYPRPWISYDTGIYDSQLSNVAQSIYNTGFLSGVTQSSVVNQTQNRYWW